MASKIPFFDMFAELQSVPELRLKLFGAELTGASIDQSTMSLTLNLEVKNPLTEEDRQEVCETLMRVYGFQKVDLEVTCVEQPKAEPKSEEPAADKKKTAAKVLDNGDGTYTFNVKYTLVDEDGNVYKNRQESFDFVQIDGRWLFDDFRVIRQ